MTVRSALYVLATLFAPIRVLQCRSEIHICTSSVVIAPTGRSANVGKMWRSSNVR